MMKLKVSWLQAILEVTQAVTAIVTFLVGVAELIHETPNSGPQKKEWVLSHFESVKKEVRDVLALLYEGDRVLKVWDFVTQPKILSVIIDILVLLFNLKGFFLKGG